MVFAQKFRCKHNYNTHWSFRCVYLMNLSRHQKKYSVVFNLISGEVYSMFSNSFFRKNNCVKVVLMRIIRGCPALFKYLLHCPVCKKHCLIFMKKIKSRNLCSSGISKKSVLQFFILMFCSFL